MLGQGAVKPTDTAEERSKNIFMRYIIYLNFLLKKTLITPPSEARARGVIPNLPRVGPEIK